MKPPISPREIRAALGLSLREVAARARCAPCTVARFEKDALLVTRRTARRLAAWYLRSWRRMVLALAA
jgi:transcriptional regulator with XRE-family HTH domain